MVKQTRSQLIKEVESIDPNLKPDDIQRMRTLELQNIIDIHTKRLQKQKTIKRTHKLKEVESVEANSPDCRETNSPDYKETSPLLREYTLMLMPSDNIQLVPEGESSVEETTGNMVRTHVRLVDEIKNLCNLSNNQYLDHEERNMAQSGIQQKRRRLLTVQAQISNMAQVIQHQISAKQKLYTLLASETGYGSRTSDQQKLEMRCSKLQICLRMLQAVPEIVDSDVHC